jgi:hypothetical protein
VILIETEPVRGFVGADFLDMHQVLVTCDSRANGEYP